MKKFLVLMLALCMSFGLCACSSSDSDDDVEEEETEEVSKSSKNNTAENDEEDEEETEDSTDEEYVCINDEFYIVTPADWAETSVDGDSVVYAMASSDGVACVLIEYYDTDSEEEAIGFVASSIDDITTVLDASSTEYETCNVNGFDMVVAVDQENDAEYTYFIGEDGLYVITCAPASSEEYNTDFETAMNSIISVNDFDSAD